MRGTGLLAAALLLTVLAHFGLPLPPTDPLRSTVVLLPLIVSILVGMERWAGERGARTTPATVLAWEALLLGSLVVITLGRYHIATGPQELLDRCLAGGFALLLLHRVAWLVMGLQSTLGDRLPRVAPSPFFVLPFIVYLAILPWTSTQRPPDGDAPHYLLLTHSLAYDFDTDLRSNYARGDSLRFMDLPLEPQLGDPQGQDGQLYSRHNMLLPLVLAPFYRLGGLFGVLVAMAALTAAAGWLTLSLVHYYEPTRVGEAILAWAVLVFTAPFILFSYQVWVEIPAAILVLVALIQIYRLRAEDGSLRWSWLGLFASLLLLPLLKIRFLLISVPLAALAIWHGGRRARRGAALLLVSLVVVTVGTLLFNQQVFQNPLKYHDIDGLMIYSQPANQYLRGFAGLFFDCAFGLFAHAPIWLLLLPAVVVLIRQKHPVLIDFCVVFLPYLILLSPRAEWFGAWSPPYRYGVVMLPVLALWLIPLLERRRTTGGQLSMATLSVLTAALTTLWLVVPGWTFNLAHGRSHLLDQLSIWLVADVARFFASSTRLRVASLIWPPVAFVAVNLLWWTGRRRWGRVAIHAGVIVALLAPAMVVWASHHRPTRIVEFEDPWLERGDGEVHPELWVIYRPQYRGGWVLPEGASIGVPIVPGGDRFDLEVELLLRGDDRKAAFLEIGDGAGGLLDRLEVDQSGKWGSVSFQGLSWAAADSLTFTLRGPEPRGRSTKSAILDRATITWK